MRHAVVRKRTRSIFVALDQGTSSIITLVLSAFVGKIATIEEFGQFAIVYTISWMVIGSARALLGESALLISPPYAEERANSANMAWCGIAIGIVAGVLLAIIAFTPVWPFQPYILVALAVSIPGILWQDAVRYIEFRRGAPAGAAITDLLWLASFVLVVSLPFGLPPNVPTQVLAWGVSALFSAVVTTFVRGLPWPRFEGSTGWFSQKNRLPVKILADFAAASGIGQLANLFVPLVASLSAAGALRAGSVAIGPLNVAIAALTVVLVPQLRSFAERKNYERLQRTALVAAALCVTLGAIVAVLLLVLPISAGIAVLGQSWPGGAAIAPVLALQQGVQMVALVAVHVLRILGSAGRVAAVRIGVVSASSAGLLLGGYFSEAAGAAFGSTIGSILGTITWWILALRALKCCRKEEARNAVCSTKETFMVSEPLSGSHNA